MPSRLAGLTKLTLETAPSVCHNCIWWQSRGRRPVDKDRWMEKVELDFGAFGTVYYDGNGRVLGSMQYGPAEAFPRAGELPGGPASDDAILVTCAYLVDETSPWVLQSLFLAAIGEARDRGATRPRGVLVPVSGGRVGLRALSGAQDGVPAAFLADLGFDVLRAAGRVGLSRLDLGGLQPVAEGKREKVLRVVKDAFGLPEPVPAPPQP